MKNNLQLGTKLFMKDGRKFGNASITEVLYSSIFQVTSDSGVEWHLNAKSIKALFHIEGKPTEADLVAKKLEETWANEPVKTTIQQN